MIPSTEGFLDQDFEIEEQANKTYRMDPNTGSIGGTIDGLEAIKQAAFKILNTERYQYVIYSWGYGIETLDLYGEAISYVCPELERRITEALTWDSRITEVTDFEFDLPKKGVVHVKFTIYTIYGEEQMEKEVAI